MAYGRTGPACLAPHWNGMESKRKTTLFFWLIFGFSPKLGLGENLSERLIQSTNTIHIIC